MANRPVPNVIQGYAAGTGYIIDAQVGASEQIYQGSFVSLDTADKYAAALTKPDPFYGVSLDNVLEGTAANGGATCRVLCEGVIQHALSSVAVADIGKVVCASDDTTLTLTNDGANSIVGILVGVPVTGTAIVATFPPRTELVDWAITNFVSDLTVDCNGAITVIGDGFGTLIQELIAQGICSGAVAA